MAYTSGSVESEPQVQQFRIKGQVIGVEEFADASSSVEGGFWKQSLDFRGTSRYNAPQRFLMTTPLLP